MKKWIKVFLAFSLLLQTSIHATSDRFLDVDSFLTICTKRLSNSAYTEQYIQLENYLADQIVTVYLRGSNNRPKEYKIYDPNHRLMHGQLFEPEDKADGGTRVVGFYSLNGKRKLCFKKDPEDAVTELAVGDFYSVLFPRDRGNSPLPASDIILMNGQLFSISQFMEGENLGTILTETEKNPNRCKKYSFHLESFQRGALFCLLTNPEDCRPENCLVGKMPNSDMHRFLFIDNERNFCKQIVKDRDGNMRTRVHCSLFCFRELLNKKVDSHLLRRNLMKDIRTWEERCGEYSEYLLELSKLTQGSLKTELNAFRDRSPIKTLNRKLHKIEALFDKRESRFTQPDVSLIDIFKATMPKLARIYLKPKDVISENSDTTWLSLQRIKSIDAGRSGTVTPPSSNVPLKEFKIESSELERAENGSFLGEVSELTGGKKTIFVQGYYRSNGTYVRGHWRAERRD